jgi:hypothetical protein
MVEVWKLVLGFIVLIFGAWNNYFCTIIISLVEKGNYNIALVHGWNHESQISYLHNNNLH